MTQPALHQGAASATLRDRVAARSIDMIYADPPFFTQANWVGKAGTFSDTWRWGAEAEHRLCTLTARDPEFAAFLRQICTDRMALFAYLLAMQEWISAAKRCLRTTGTFFLHCDDHASAELRMICDRVFGPHRFWGAIVWRRHNAHGMVSSGFSRVHDTILTYVRTGAAFDRLGRPWRGLATQAASHGRTDGVARLSIESCVEKNLGSRSEERVGYPTQKPLALLRLLLETGSRQGDLILDPCCGSGTTLVAAQQMFRRSIGIDLSADAIKVARERTREVTYQADLFGESAA